MRNRANNRRKQSSTEVRALKHLLEMRFSLTGRLIAVVVGCQLLLTAVLTLMAVVYGHAELREAFDSALEARATSVLALVRYDENDPPGLLFDSSLLPRSSRLRRRDGGKRGASSGGHDAIGSVAFDQRRAVLVEQSLEQ